ncbi:MAG: hypothetical protein BroJett040_03730 [Oligoflexia bacterium]|nr:MAG: hypothetical protein BroJett040_03730 [Oligoflexia bacterium]
MAAKEISGSGTVSRETYARLSKIADKTWRLAETQTRMISNSIAKLVMRRNYTVGPYFAEKIGGVGSKLMAFLASGAFLGIDLMLTSGETQAATMSEYYLRDEQLFSGDIRPEDVCAAYRKGSNDERAQYAEKLSSMLAMIKREQKPTATQPPAKDQKSGVQ